ncbi:permease-like cell division protein FtsX [Streptosporangium sp. CA-135522]|uniref:permease-like cell division protein FtsX n=1 Tax=Streptosporangium sp. CA-135522 TaxID=3240072 RepID=UPI003D949AB8
MTATENRLREALSAAAGIAVEIRPLTAPARRGPRPSPRIVAVALAVAAIAFGVVRLTAPSPELQGESIVAMSVSAVEPSGRPRVSVFFCKHGDPWPSCAGEGITETERENLRRALQARPEVESLTFEDRQQAWEDFQRQYKDDDPELARAIVPEDLPESFRVRIKPDADPAAVARAASELPGVSTSVDQACALDRSSPWGYIVNFLGLGEQCFFKGKGR